MGPHETGPCIPTDISLAKEEQTSNRQLAERKILKPEMRRPKLKSWKQTHIGQVVPSRKRDRPPIIAVGGVDIRSSPRGMRPWLSPHPPPSRPIVNDISTQNQTKKQNFCWTSRYDLPSIQTERQIGHPQALGISSFSEQSMNEMIRNVGGGRQNKE